MTDPENQLFLIIGRVEGKLDASLSRHEATDKRLEVLEELVKSHDMALSKSSGVLSTIHYIYALVAGLIGAFSDNIFKWITT